MTITSSTVGLVPDYLKSSMIGMWTHDSVHPAQFYRTGFETIFFNHNRKFALKCVLSSVVPDDREIVIAGRVGLLEVEAIAEKYHISNILYDAASDEMAHISTLLYARQNISHLVLVIGSDDDAIENYIPHLLAVLQHQRIELVIFCASSVHSINERSHGSVDYMIGGWDEAPDNSFVVARRNKLVQTEGNSRSLIHDLHASWQWSLQERGTRIFPMEM
jgi:hypothetical protein